MNLTNTKRALERFNTNVETKAKDNLKRKGKTSSGELYDSIKGDLKVSANSFELTYDLADYWEFVDYGVKGVGGTKADGTAWQVKNVTNNKFKYTTKRPPYMAFNGWVVRKGIAPRNDKGQFTSRKGLMIAIANSVYHTGLETTSFFTKPFEDEFKDLPDEVIESFSLDLDNFLEFSLKD